MMIAAGDPTSTIYITLKMLQRQTTPTTQGAPVEGMDVLLEGHSWSLAPVVYQLIGTLVRVIRDYPAR